MIIVAILAIIIPVLFVWWIFFSGPWLAPEPNNIYFLGIGFKYWFIIDGDNIPWYLPKIPVPKWFRIIPIPLEWGIWVEGMHRKDEKIGNTIGNNNPDEPKFKDVKVFPTASDGFYAIRREWVPSLKKLEPTSYYTDILTKDAYDFTLITTFYLEVKKPAKVFKRPLFKMLGKDATNSFLGPWGRNETIDGILSTNINLITDPNCGISINGDDLVTHLNKNEFVPLGVEIEKKYLKIIKSPGVVSYLTLESESKVHIQETKNAEEYGKRRKVERQIELADETQISEITKLREKDTLEPINNLIDKIYDGRERWARAQPNLLAFYEPDKFGNDAITELVKRMSKVGSATSSEKARKEEVPDGK